MREICHVHCSGERRANQRPRILARPNRKPSNRSRCIPGWLTQRDARSLNPNDKTNLAPYRFLHLAIVIILGVRFIPIDASGLHATI